METAASVSAAHELVNGSRNARGTRPMCRHRILSCGQTVLRSAIRAAPEMQAADRASDVTAVVLLTVAEAASLLRTTRKGIYAMVERQQIAGVIRLGRRVLFRRDDLLHWLDQKRAPSPLE
jgi:excisionase family DNA binding protein